MQDWQLSPGRPLRGRVVVPGDKSVAHRALMLAAVSDADSTLTGVPAGGDVASTLAALRQLGAGIVQRGGTCEVQGRGLHGLRPPGAAIDCGNSGTTMRLLAGLLAGAGIEATLTGDRSLLRRPMARVAEPLRAMGSEVHLLDEDHGPIVLRGGGLRAVTYRPPLASAQVKSCVLLAGMYAEGWTRVVEATATRDHTERLLRHMGATTSDDEGFGVLGPATGLGAVTGELPGDASSAAYWIAAGSVTPGSDIELIGVGVNPTRRAFLDLMLSWGAAVEEVGCGAALGEPRATLRVCPAVALQGGEIAAAAAVALIDELPLIGMLAPFTRHGVEIRGAGELRHKESDRIESTCAALRALGVRVQEYPDGFAVQGRQTVGGGSVEGAGDHRVVLATAAIAGAAEGQVCIRGAATAAVSYPGFLQQWQELAS